MPRGNTALQLYGSSALAVLAAKVKTRNAVQSLSLMGKLRRWKIGPINTTSPDRETMIAGDQMDVFELTHKTTGHNLGGVKIDISVVGRGGRVWSIEEAGRLIITSQAKFLYDGKVVTDLSALPEMPTGTKAGS